MITSKMIKRDYPHRIAADPSYCPVCCGDRRTTDPAYGGKVMYVLEHGREVRECLACVVWVQERWPYRISCAKCDEIIQAPCREKMPHSICPHCGEDYHYYEADLAPNGEPWGDVCWDDPA